MTPKSTAKLEKAKHPDMVKIPEGDYIIGISDDQINHLVRTEIWATEWYERDMFMSEQPQHTFHLKAFEIAKSPVTNAAYYAFIWETGYRVPKDWIGFHYPDGQDSHPVAGVSKVDCIAYLEWFNQHLHADYRLPSEAEWECAARGGDTRLYPWGEDFDPWRCNTVESGKRGTTNVGEYSPSGDSPFGVMDMAGNVWEWTCSLLQPYPYDPGDGREDLKGRGKFVIRGGSWYYSHKLARATTRESALDNFTSPALGFRLAKNI
ncbi:MAG: SUMF1/EgtB/PvdO family nonheme iron enzyme [Anaerolineales bacterium]|nr:SUMF1/EgtB/PvdO family nonheme iron enzyme [Anaerolineales bacterium]